LFYANYAYNSILACEQSQINVEIYLRLYRTMVE